MTAVNRTTLYSYFLTGSRPSQQQFANLIDSTLNVSDPTKQTIVSNVSALGSLGVAGGFNVSGLSTLNGLLVPNQATITSAVVTNLVTTSAAITVLNVTGLTTLGSATCVTPPSNDSSINIPNTAWVNPSNLQAQNGFEKSPAGIIRQWGLSQSVSAGVQSAVSFTSAFANSVWYVDVTPVTNATQTTSNSVNLSGTSSFLLTNGMTSNSTFLWSAIGN